MDLRKKFIVILLGLLPMSSAFGFVGFGLHLGQNQLSLPASKQLIDITFDRSNFGQPFAFGGYFYIDAIPFIDLDAEFQVTASKYDLEFKDSFTNKSINSEFAWGSASTYLTARKKLFGLGIPFLANAKLHYGIGYNKHVVTPMADFEMVQGLTASASSTLEESLTKYLEDNKKDFSGFHVQAGLKAKLFMGEVDLFYRYVIAKDMVPDSKGFGSLNLRLGVTF
ncbi:MAG: hypothetical protein U9N31_07825 [Candidatus Marinimicrobia bacterium]|nr:hypothetical protein [Candidatus Neomarinimicrobiota bacterium]